VDTTVLGLSAEEAVMKPYIASMGIYVFKKDVLLKLLRYPTPMRLSYCRYCTYVFLI
jgi:glucose-1-phosphate adenylyltransferase